MKNKKLIIALIAILSIISILLIVFMISMMNGKTKLFHLNFYHSVSNELVLDKVYDNIFSEIDIQTDASDIVIKESSDETIRVVIYGDKERTTVKTDNNELSIKSDAKKCIGFCFNTTIAKVEIYLPSDFNSSITIYNNYGDVQIDEFLNSDINVTEDCGDVSILGGKEVTVKNSYGDIKIEEATNINVEESAGDVTIGNVSDITVQNSYGDITIEQVSNYLNVSDDCGDIKINNIVIQKDSMISNDLGDIKIGSTNEIYIEAKTDLGDVEVNKNFPKSDITLKIENDCGDITVNN